MASKHNNKTPEENFKYQKLKDRYKRMFAKFNGYHYLEINYLEFNSGEWKTLIDNKIKEIERKVN